MMKHKVLPKLQLNITNSREQEKEISDKSESTGNMAALTSTATTATATPPVMKRSGFFRSDKQRHLQDFTTGCSNLTTPRSPITKAFDFLPWARRTKTQAGDKKENIKSNDESIVHYQKNIFRNGGGIIRDILGDKLNKDKLIEANGKPKSLPPRKGKFLSRNKSLDIHELIDSVERDLAKESPETPQTNGKRTPPNRFLDDTYVEYNNNNINSKDFPCNGISECVHCDDEVAEVTQPQHSPRHKHILFNDENTVYLIKNELPVKRDGRTHARTKQLPPAGGGEKSPKQSSEQVMRARLKFKRLRSEGEMTQSPPTNARSRSLQRPQHIYANDYHQHHHHQQHQYHHNYDEEIDTHRHPPQPLPLPLPSNHQNQRHAVENQTRQRRRSFSENNHYELHCSSTSSTCSSLCSGGGVGGNGNANAGGSGGGGIMLERPKTDKPRKKLSFREPIVADKTAAGGGTIDLVSRFRRRSSPLERTTPPTNNEKREKETALGNGNGVGNDKVTGCFNQDCDNLLYNNRIQEAASCSALTQPNHDDDESQAMRIVRTVGQAFEVCHKFNLHKNSLEPNDERSDVSSELLDVEQISEQQLSDDGAVSDILQQGSKKDHLTLSPDLNHSQPQARPNHLELLPQTSINIRKSSSALSDGDDKSPTTPSSPRTEISKLKDQLEQQALQTRQALAQLMLVREQLISETNARIEAQARTQQLLQQNRELLEHLASLGAYSEQQTPGLTSANIGMAPQSQLQMLLAATSNNNNLATINQQINSLGNINQQLTSLSHQLSGLNQQSQNLQNLQNLQQQQSQIQTPSSSTTTSQPQPQQQQTPPPNQLTPSSPSIGGPSTSNSLRHSQLQLNVNAGNAVSSAGVMPCSTSSSLSPFPSMNQLQNISSQLQQLNTQQQQQQHAQDALSKDLFQVNQELLNRLQSLNIGGAGASGASQPGGSQSQTPNNNSAFFYANPMSCSPANNNNTVSNFNFLGTPNSLGGGNLTPSPLNTLNRNSYAGSSFNEDIRLSIEQNLNSLDEQLKAAVSNGNLAGILASSSSLAGGNSSGGGGGGGNGGGAGSGSCDNSRSSSTIDSPSSPRHNNNNSSMFSSSNSNINNIQNHHHQQQQQQQQQQQHHSQHSPNEARFNTVMLRVTDESGNITNQRKLSATPSFITRSTSEKVPNRSQMMSQVQRTAWARHTTK